MDFLFLQISVETYLWNSAEQKYRETGVSLPWLFLSDDGITTVWQAEKQGSIREFLWYPFPLRHGWGVLA